MSEPEHGDAMPDPREPVDPRIDTMAREGLTGTAPQSLYQPLAASEHITRPPDGRSMDEQPAWRMDFPIDWTQDLHVARRDFTKFMVLTSGAFTAGQFWIGLKSLLEAAGERLIPKRIAALVEIPEGSIVTFTYPTDHDPCFLVRSPSGRLIAFSQKCTHLSCSVLPRPADGTIHCPCHEGYFDLETGRPIAGPPPRPLPRIALEVRGDDIYAVDVELRTT